MQWIENMMEMAGGLRNRLRKALRNGDPRRLAYA